MTQETIARPGCTLDPLTGAPMRGHKSAAPPVVRPRTPSDDFEAGNLGQIVLGQYINVFSYRTGLPAERVREDGFFNRAEVKAGDVILVQADAPPVFFFLAVAGRVETEKDGRKFANVVTAPVDLPADPPAEAKGGFLGLGKRKG